jgi:hypothetical protein
VIVDERFQLASRFSRECGGKNQDDSECVRFSINAAVAGVLSLHSWAAENTTKRAKSVPWETTYSRSIPGTHPKAGRKLHDYCIDDSGAEISATKKTTAIHQIWRLWSQSLRGLFLPHIRHQPCSPDYEQKVNIRVATP